MKAYIHKINRYLIERYPNIWNTKLVWVITISLAIHLLFFLLGLIGLSNPESLHSYRAKDVFFNSGVVFFNVILSVLIVVVWLINLFKNNAFKAFYPTKKLDLFKQFCCYFIAIFFCSSFFLSYQFGVKTYIISVYPDQEMLSKIKTANQTAVFLSHNIKDYTINNKRFPDFYFNNFCESNSGLIDYKTDHYSIFEFDYQFYNVKAIDYTKKLLRGSDVEGYLYRKEKDSLTTTYFYKDSVIDAKPYIKTLLPSYYNYSETFYLNSDLDEFEYNQYSKKMVYRGNHQDYRNYTQERYLRSKNNTNLLDRNNPQEIKNLLAEFLQIANSFKIEHNLNTNVWFDLVYHPSNFEIKHFIYNTKPSKYRYNSNKERTASETYRKDHDTSYYINSDELKTAFNNIDSIKNDSGIFDGFHVFLWLAFSLALLVFIFRVTGLKTLLFSIVSAGVITMLVTLILFIIFYFVEVSGSDEEYVVAYLGLIVGALILIVPWFYYKSFRKMIVGICLNISIVGFLPFILLIIGIISMHQDDYYRDVHFKDFKEYQTLIELFGVYWSYIFIVLGFIFIYFYSATIKKWKALPEG